MLPASGSNYDLILEALKTRGGIMFEGKNGAAILSGIKADAASAEKPTYALCRAAIYVVFNVLPGVLFDPLAQHRPCGVLDRYEAVGMLIRARTHWLLRHLLRPHAQQPPMPAHACMLELF